jgi:hypothetical protein
MAVPGSQGVVGGMKSTEWKFYLHPQGSRIIVGPGIPSGLSKFNAKNELVSTSAEPELLAKGHGRWYEVSEDEYNLYAKRLGGNGTNGNLTPAPKRASSKVPKVKPHWQPGQGQGLQRKRVS